MSKPISFILLTILSLSPFLVFSQIFNVDVEAKIDVQLQGEVYQLFFSSYNKTAVNKSLKYQTKIFKKATERVKEEQFEQEDFFVLLPKEKKNIARANVIPKDHQRIIAFILIYEDDKVIGKDRIEIEGVDDEEGVQASYSREKNQGISRPTYSEINLMRGVVVEETKTKPGRDFFRDFYLEYTANNINGEKIVKVKEELAIGGNTMIKIFAGDDLVTQFFVNPQANYLKEMAMNSVSRINYYFRQNRDIQQDLIKY